MLWDSWCSNLGTNQLTPHFHFSTNYLKFGFPKVPTRGLPKASPQPGSPGTQQFYLIKYQGSLNAWYLCASFLTQWKKAFRNNTLNRVEASVVEMFFHCMKVSFLWSNTLLASKYWFEAFSGLYYRRWNSLPMISRRPSCFPIHHSHPFITFLFLIPH